jgi:hypothetical protein
VRFGGGVCRGRRIIAAAGSSLHPQADLYVADARYLLGKVFSPPPGLAVVDAAAERHFATLNRNLDVGGVNIPIAG